MQRTNVDEESRQMCGRAGRKGKDNAGETYLICVKADMQAVCDLLDADMPAIESCLAPEKRGLKRYVFLSWSASTALTYISQGVAGSHSRKVGGRLRGNQRLRTVHTVVPHLGQETCIQHHELGTARTSR